MCYHTSLVEESVPDLQRKLQVKIWKYETFKEKYKPNFHINGFDHPQIPVIRPEGKTEKVVDLLRWGLIPHWVKEPKEWKANTLLARNDEMFDKASYKHYWQNRCLVIVTGFFEPRDRQVAGLVGPASKVQKTESWYIKSKTEPFLFLGGLYCNGTVCVITTDTSPMMSKIHNDGKRMPLILDDPDMIDEWLLSDMSKEEMIRMMDSHPDDDSLMAYRTLDGIMNNRVNTNVPEANLPHAEDPVTGVLL